MQQRSPAGIKACKSRSNGTNPRSLAHPHRHSWHRFKNFSHSSHYTVFLYFTIIKGSYMSESQLTLNITKKALVKGADKRGNTEIQRQKQAGVSRNESVVTCREMMTTSPHTEKKGSSHDTLILTNTDRMMLRRIFYHNMASKNVP